MTVDVDSFLNQWVYDLQRKLQSQLDALKDDLCCGDEEVEEQAAQEASEILTLLYGAVKPVSHEERKRIIERALEKSGLTAQQIRALAKTGARVTGQNRGRPRDMGPYAIRVLFLRLTTNKSWREIAMEVTGCTHVCPACGRPKTETFQGGSLRRPRLRCQKCGLTIKPAAKVKLACRACGDNVRHLAQEYRPILERRGVYPKAPGRSELRGLSPSELEEIWPPHD